MQPSRRKTPLSPADLLGLLPSAVVTVTPEYIIGYANAGAEAFFGEGRAALTGRQIVHFIHPATRLMELIDSAFTNRTLIKEYDAPLGVRGGLRTTNIQILPLDDAPEAMIVIDDRGIVQHMPQRESARFTSGMASILAHEVKNPLSGIRGAAQLLEKAVSDEDAKLTALIVSEVDRIKDVIEEMEIFSNPSELKVENVNIHEVLQYVRLLSEQGFASHIRFREVYDPSIPDVPGHRNLLIQLILNLVKNSSEALAKHPTPSITLSTSYQGGLRMKTPGTRGSRALPVVVSIEDNGPGIAADLRASIFDPFVTTKEGGHGLGLAVVAKIVADHGGVIALDENVKEGSRFRIFLPAA